MADPAEEILMKRTGHFVIVLSLLALTPACVVRARGSMSTSDGVAYQEPPAPRVETHENRDGYVWVSGRWDWRNGQWAWMEGHWENQRVGYVWTEGRWERRGNQWHWIEGSWSGTTTVDVRDHRHQEEPPPTVDVRDHRDGGSSNNGMYPTAAPPAPRTENPGNAQSGYIWVTGRWDWQNGNWTWLDGHWERMRARKTWVNGRWEVAGDHWVWVEGGWN
jgi:hypothetical protein